MRENSGSNEANLDQNDPIAENAHSQHDLSQVFIELNISDEIEAVKFPLSNPALPAFKPLSVNVSTFTNYFCTFDNIVN